MGIGSYKKNLELVAYETTERLKKSCSGRAFFHAHASGRIKRELMNA